MTVESGSAKFSAPKYLRQCQYLLELGAEINAPDDGG